MASGCTDLPCLAVQKDGLVFLCIYVQPRAAKNGFIGMYDGCLKLAVTSPPVDNRANIAVISYLAKFFHIARNRIRLESGEKSRRKVFCIDGIELADIRERLGPLLEQECATRS